MMPNSMQFNRQYNSNGLKSIQYSRHVFIAPQKYIYLYYEEQFVKERGQKGHIPIETQIDHKDS